MSLLTDLNPQQRQAAAHINGPLLILAGAGSGKTRVITTRIAHLIADHQVAADQILALTFTNKAAAEMRERANRLVRRNESPRTSTFHAFGVQVIKQYSFDLGLSSGFTICDEAAQQSIVKSILKNLTRDHLEINIRNLLFLLSLHRNRPTLDDTTYTTREPLLEDLEPLYIERLRSLNYVDFDDLIQLPVQLMSTNESARQQLAQQHQFIMVDEYQDTNHIQDSMLALLARDHRNICVVGDDDQSIYGWRGALSKNILSFPERWDPCQVVKLEQNYRSTNTILKAANAVISNNTERMEKQLWSGLGTGEKIRYRLLPDERDEAEYVAQSCRQLMSDSAYKWSDIAILYRRNTQSRAIEEQLRMLSIPYRVVGGLKYYDRREIRDILSYLKLMVNPKDELSIERIANVPARGLGQTTLSKISDYAHHQNTTLDIALREAFKNRSLQPEKAKICERFINLLDRYRKLFSNAPLGNTLRDLLNEIGYRAFLKKIAKDEADFSQKVESVKDFIQSLYDFEERHKNADLSAFLDRILMIANEDSNSDDDRNVTLMSMHASKGLEFPVVFLIGMEEGIFPSQRALDESNDDREERRLAYVGITRAKFRLTLSATAQRKRFNETIPTKLSRFLFEIPEELYQFPPGSEDTVSLREDVQREAADSFFKKLKSFKSDI